MAFNVGGAFIAPVGSNLNLNNGMLLGAAGAATLVTRPPGMSGAKSAGATDLNNQSPPNAAWALKYMIYDSGHQSNGTFTCPVAGFYWCVANGITNGGSDVTPTAAYGYFGFSKNMVVTAFGHVNQMTTSSNAWSNSGISQLLQCAAGDQIRFHVNTAPLPSVSPGGTYGTGWGWYPQDHHEVYVIKVG